MIDVLVTWAYRRRALVIGAAFCILAVSAEGARRLSFETDVLTLLPRDGRVIPAFRSFLSTFGSLDQLYVVFTAPEGYPIADYSDRIDAWIDQLRAAPEIDRVDAGVADESRNVGWLADRQLLLLDDRTLDEALDRLRPEGLSAAVASRRELLTLPSSNVADLVRHDPAGLFELTQKAFGGRAPDRDGRRIRHAGRIEPARHRASQPATVRCGVLARARCATAQHRRSTDRSVAQDAAIPPALRVELAGGHRIAVETEAFIRRESIVNTLGSLALILPLLYFVFRSPWLVAVGSLPSALSLIVVLGILGFTGATLSAAATGSAAMLFGLGVDGVVLLYVSHRLALARGLDPRDGRSGHRRTLEEHAARHVDDGGDLLRADVRGFSESSGAGAARRTQHGRLRTGDALSRARHAAAPRAATSSARSCCPASQRGSTGIERPSSRDRSPRRCCSASPPARIRVNPTLERLRSVTDAAALEARIGSTFGLPGEVSVIVAAGTRSRTTADDK